MHKPRDSTISDFLHTVSICSGALQVRCLEMFVLNCPSVCLLSCLTFILESVIHQGSSLNPEVLYFQVLLANSSTKVHNLLRGHITSGLFLRKSKKHLSTIVCTAELQYQYTSLFKAFRRWNQISCVRK